MDIAKLFVLFLGIFLLNASFSCCQEDSDTNDELPDDGVEEPSADDKVDARSSEPIEEENDVLVLTEDNFDLAIDMHDTILVEFYAPWCGHCKKLAPEYEAAALSLKQREPPVPLAKIDATVHSAIGERFGVTGYPTLKFFKKGKVFDYEGPRMEQGIVSYMRERAAPDWAPPPSAVVVLTSENFTSFISNNDLSLVQFYAPWCGHCKRLAPEYERAALRLKEEDNIPLAKVDATVDPDLAKEYGVTGYPTLKVFRSGKEGEKGKEYEYRGDRNNAQELVLYMQKQKGIGTKDESSLKGLQRAFEKDDITVVGFFESEEAAEFDVYKFFTNNVRDDYTLLHSFDKESRNFYKVNPNSLVVFNAERFYTKYEPKWYIFEIKPETSEDEMLEFIQSHEIPLVGHLTYKARTKRYLNPEKKARNPLVIFFYDVDWSFEYKVATELNRQKAVKLAKNYRDSAEHKDKPLTFVVADEKESAELFKGFGFEDSGEDLNIGILSPDDKKYPMPPFEDYDSDDLEEFIARYFSGQLEPKLKSERPPKKQGIVTTVVADTFKSIVLDKSKDVLIEFYAPWCGHCKKLEPKYKSLAKKLKGDKNLVIAKIDATANDFPDYFSVSGYPSIYFVPANKKRNPIQYKGENEVDKLMDFIKENAAVSMKKKKEEL